MRVYEDKQPNSPARLIPLSAEKSIQVKAVKALIGPDLEPLDNVTIIIKQGMIQEIYTHKRNDLPATVESMPCYELPPGSTLLPAFTDAHIHLALNGNNTGRKGSKSFNEAEKVDHCLEQIESRLALMAGKGIGLIRDGGDCKARNLQFKKEYLINGGKAPQIIATGEALRPSLGYGGFLGSGYSNRRELIELLSRNINNGADQVKVIISGIVSFYSYGKVGGRLMLRDDLDYIVKTAHFHGLKVMAHASSHEAVALAVAAGVDYVEHGYFTDPDLLKEMAEKEIAWVPTVLPLAVQLTKSFFPRWTKVEADIIKRTMEEQLRLINLAAANNLLLGLGTDARAVGVGYGDSLYREMLLYRSAGVSEKRIIKSATVINAAVLGLSHEAGTIEKGKKASLIAVEGNPLQDISVLQQPLLHFMPA